MDFLATPGALLIFALGFGFLIFVHELGHFLAAKSVGVKCPQFAIGFGQALISFRKGIGFKAGSTENIFFERVKGHLAEQGDPLPDDLDEAGWRASGVQNKVERAAKALGLGETEYRLNWMPLGGYVKMLGQEDMDPNAVSDDPRAFNNQPFWPRALIISAGVIMNTIFAFIFFVAAFMAGVGFPPAVIGYVEPGSPAATTAAEGEPNVVGLRPGDMVVEVNGEEPSDFTSISIASALAKRDVPISLLVERPGEVEGPAEGRHLFNVMPKPNELAEGLMQIGIAPPYSMKVMKVRGEAARAEFVERYVVRPEAALTAIDGQKVSGYHELREALNGARGRELELTYLEADGATTTLHLATRTDLETDEAPSRVDESKKALVGHLSGLVPPVRVAKVLKDGAAERHLREGDVVAAIDNLTWPTLPDAMAKIRESDGSELTFRVIRDGQEVSVAFAPKKKWLIFGRYLIGVEFGLETDSNRIAHVMDGSPLKGLNLLAGTRITSLGGREVKSYNDLRLAVEEAGAGAAGVTLMLPTSDGAAESASVEMSEETIAAVSGLEWGSEKLPPLDELRLTQKADSIGEAMVFGVEKTHLYMMMTYVTLERLIVQRTVQVKHLRGPVGIAQAGTNIFLDRGFTYVIFFLGLISINLAVVNFLPLPIVDGGLFLMLILEKIRGKPVSARVQSAINYAGILFLATIFLIVTFHDISRLITG